MIEPQPEIGEPVPDGTYIISLYETLKYVLKTNSSLLGLPLLEVNSFKSSTSKRWYSFDEMIALLEKYETDPDLTCVQSLDKCFGNDTFPFIMMSKNQGTNVLVDNILEKYSNALNNLIFKLGEKLSLKWDNDEVATAMNLSKLKYEYKKYFTEDSVEDVLADGLTENDELEDLEFKLGTSFRPNEYITEAIDELISYFDVDDNECDFNEQILYGFIAQDGDSAEALRHKYYLYERDYEDMTADEYNELIESIDNRGSFLDSLKFWIVKRLESSKDAFSATLNNTFTQETVDEYMSDYPLHNEVSGTGKSFGVDFRFPQLDYNEDGDLTLIPHDSEEINLFNKIYYQASPDIDKGVLESLVHFIRLSLSGVNESEDSEYVNQGVVSYLGGKSDLHPESLYGMRYSVLNSRMNRVSGNLYLAASMLTNSEFLDESQKIADQKMQAYSMMMDVLPIASMDKLNYLPTQTASMTTVALSGKFYSDKEMNALRSQIHSKCVLTCTKCSVASSCPFYDENEVVKMSCTPMETIDIYLKDNELELIDEDSIEVVDWPEGTGEFNVEDLRETHKKYADILANVSDEEGNTTIFDTRSIDNLVNELKQADSLEYDEYVDDGMRWIIGARYGTIEYNENLNGLLIENHPELEDKLSPYKYCYDALFMDIRNKDNTGKSVLDRIPFKDEDSYIGYRLSKLAYPVTYSLGPTNQKQTYKVKVKLKMPAYIKMLYYAGNDDDVYLVSDDKEDSRGKPLNPIIYLGKVKNLKYAFDIIEDEPKTGNVDRESADPDNINNIYASDVAQWCMNYIKGHCTDDPVGKTDMYSNKDQYWMEKIYKKVNRDGQEEWMEIPGRPRIRVSSEALIDPGNYDEALVLSGHPIIASYCDFIRKVSIRIYDPSIENEDDRWLIPWVNENLITSSNGLSLEQMKETQRATLPLMKTNLRLVVVKN